MLVELAVVVRVPAVAADQNAQAPGGGIDNVDDMLIARFYKATFIVDRVKLALRLAQRQAVGGEHHAGVVQRAVADLQLPLDHARVGQGDGTGHQGHAKFFGEAAKQHLIVAGHGRGFHAQVCIVHAVVAGGADPGFGKLQRVADRQPVHGVLEVSGLVQLILFSAEHQPSADMFRQHHNGLGIDQPKVPGILQVGGQLQMQAFQALVIGREQFRLDTQQVAPVGWFALVDGEGDAQVGQVMRHGALLGPDQIRGEGGNQGHDDGER